MFPVGAPAEFALSPDGPFTLRLADGLPEVWLSTFHGFLFQISGPVHRLVEVLPALLVEHPLEWAVVTDREPWREPYTGLYVWRRPAPGVPEGDGGDRLPHHVFDMLNPDRSVVRSHHQSQSSAITDLSDAIIAWALAQPTPTR
jgi:hypothetical protein